MKIPFNKPFLTGQELNYIQEAIDSGKISGDGIFTKRSQDFFCNKYGFKKCLLTTSCTDALEMCALLLEIKPGDEVIMPSYTFVSTANAFVLRGAKIVFADSHMDNPNMDISQVEKLITSATKAIVVVHYAGVACDMDMVMTLAEKYNLWVVEDAAQAINSYYKNKPLGSIGHLAAFSFHETKNIQCGEGGMIVINEDRFIRRAEIIREKGTNRASFFRGEVDKYGWVDIGSSFLPSEINAAFLMAQLENLERIQKRREEIWSYYYTQLKPLSDKGAFQLCNIPDYATNNAHMFYIVCNNPADREKLLANFKENDVLAVFHYLSLHNSEFYRKRNAVVNLPNSDHFSDCLLRLPFYIELSNADLLKVVNLIKTTYNQACI